MSSVYSRPIATIIARLAYQADPAFTDRLLSGFKLIDRPTGRNEGLKDFPVVAVSSPAPSEEYQPTRRGIGTLQLNVAVAVAKSQGLPGLMDAVSAVLNSIEIDAATGELNCCMNNALEHPVEFSLGSNGADELCLSQEIILTMKLRPFERGRR